MCVGDGLAADDAFMIFGRNYQKGCLAYKHHQVQIESLFLSAPWSHVYSLHSLIGKLTQRLGSSSL